MGGLFGGGGQTISTEEQRIGALRIQTSAYGLPIPIIYGRARVQGNLIWYDDFKAVPHTTTQSSGGGGGKGGGEVTSSNTSYTYTTSFMLGIAEGPITGIGRVWKDKAVVADASTLFNVFTGSYPQSPWSYLAGFNPTMFIQPLLQRVPVYLNGAMITMELGYQGLAYVAAANYDLGASADLPNHSFEATGVLPWNVGAGIYDANPRDVLTDFLSNPHYGVCPDGFPTGNLTQFSNWCVASGVFISPAYSEQKAANETITALARIGNAGVFHSEGLLKIVPYGDATVTGNGVTFTPYLTPAYDLTDDDYLENGDEDPVICDRTTPADAFNSVTIEYYDRANDYNVATVEAKDQANIEIYGLRPMPPIQMHEICDAAVARAVAQAVLQRELYIRNTYEFSLGWNYSRLEPMDILTLTDANLGLDRAPVRVIEIEEADEEFVVRAEEMLIGTASPALYSHQAGGGYSVNYQAPSGNINDPVLFEPPVDLTGGRMEIWAAVSGGPLWGGCEVWASDDNATFSRVGYISGPARHGILTALLPSVADTDTGSTLAVDLTVSRGELLGVTKAQADALDTLCWVDGELIAYRDATLTATNKYNLGYLRRGQYGTAVGAHNVNSKFARLDGALVRIPFDVNRIGKPIYIKFPSYNIYGGARENLADIPAYTYAITGIGALAPPSDVPWFSATGPVLSWGNVADVDLAGYRMRWIAGLSRDWGQAQVLHDGLVTASPWAMPHVPVGPATLLIKAVDTSGNESLSPAAVTVNLGDPLIDNIITTHDLRGTGFPGQIGGGSVSGGNLLADIINSIWNPNAAALMWSANDASPMWGLTYYRSLTYRAIVTVSAAESGSQMTIAKTLAGDAWSLEYRRTVGDVAPMWGSFDTLMWSGDDNAPMRGNAPGWMPWPGAITAEAGDYEIRVHTAFGLTRGRIDALAINFDVPDITEYLHGVSIATIGTRLTPAKSYHAIRAVHLTLQDDGGAARTARVMDKSLSGPLINCFDSSSAATTGHVDAIIQGY